MADNDASPDAQTDLKKKARRRLVGAAALALLAVIVLPILMDHEARPTSPDVQIRIPAMEAGLTPSAAPVESRSVPTADSHLTALPGPSESPTALSPSAAASPAPAPPAAVPVAAADKPLTVPPDAHAAEKMEKTSSPKAADSANHGASATESSSTQWVVRLGVYQSAANVKRLVAKLRELSVPSYTEKADVPQGPRTRVGAGPFASREAAEKAQAKIRRVGVEGSVAEKL